ncbi:MAG: hypothetical protein MJ197_03530 [Bacteroidales bacterium]|nr:hypothetical protein [Bacteroidales bacterium]
MTPTDQLILQEIHSEGIQPCIIDEADENTTYIGYCLPDCKSFSDLKWLIKRIKTEGSIQTIAFPNASRKFDKAWEKRTTYTYKLTPNLKA